MTTTRSSQNLGRVVVLLWGLSPLSLGGLGACSDEANVAAPTRDDAPTPEEVRDPFFKTKLALATDVPSGTGATDEALRHAAARALELPKKEDLWVLLGQAWAEHARVVHDPEAHTRADAAADVALALRPDYAPALAVKGLALLDGHRFREAQDLAERILKDRHDDAMAHGILADALLELGDIDGATRAAERMIEIKPNLPSYSRVAWLSYLKGDLAAAQESWRLAFDAGRGAKNKEPATWVLVEAATLFFEQGDVEGALAGAEYALKYNPGFAAAEVLQARCLSAQGRHDDATRLLASAMERRPDVMTAYWLGLAHQKAGRVDDAEAAFTRARELGARDGLALARVLGGLGREPAAALAAIEKERRAGRDGVEVRLVYALSLARAGRGADALDVVRTVEKIGVPDALVAFVKGLALTTLGQHPEAGEAFRAALGRNPHFDASMADEARELLRGGAPPGPAPD